MLPSEILRTRAEESANSRQFHSSEERRAYISGFVMGYRDVETGIPAQEFETPTLQDGYNRGRDALQKGRI